MTTVQDVADRLKAFDLDFVIEEAFDETKQDYIDLQREQLFAGLNSKGNKIEPPYAPRTVAIKKKKGQPTDRVTEKDKGDFYKEIFVEPRADSNIFIVDSADPKSGDLQKKYGKEIFGLDDENQTEYVNAHLEPVFLEKTRNALEL